MGKKSKGKHYESKGQRPNVSRKTLNAMKADDTDLDRFHRQVAAWRRGKRVMLTIRNPNENERNKPFIRVEAKHVWGIPNVKQNESKAPSAPIPGSSPKVAGSETQRFTEA